MTIKPRHIDSGSLQFFLTQVANSSQSHFPSITFRGDWNVNSITYFQATNATRISR
jgi:hypothetical protein